MIEAVVLGSGTSSGVPIVGKSYPEAFLANPRNWRTRPSLLLRGPDGNVLVDCGTDMRTQLLREQVSSLAAVIVTHTHADHIMGMDDLRSYCLRQKAPMPIYTLPEHEAQIRRVFDYAFEEFPPGIEVPRFDLRGAPAVLETAGMTIRLGVVMHGPIRVLALRVNDFAYITDVKTVPEESLWLTEGLESLVLDAVRIRPHANHMNLEEALAAIEQWGPRQTWLTHLSDDFDDNSTQLPEGVALAYDGLAISVG